MLIKAFKNSKTTYNVDKVVEQLKRASYTEAQDDMNPYEPTEVVALSDAIEIVKERWNK